jgi:hypothetical protein
MTDAATLDSVRERIVDPLADRLAQEYGSSSVAPVTPGWVVKGERDDKVAAMLYVAPSGRVDVLWAPSVLVASLRAEGLL